MASDLTPEQLDYLRKRGIPADQAQVLYQQKGSDLLIPYRDPQGEPYVIRSSDKLADGEPYIVRRPFPQQVPKFRTPAKGGNRPYFSPLMPPAALSDISWPLVVVEGPIKCDALWLAIPTGYCFIALSGVWNFKDRRDITGVWRKDAEETTYLPELKALKLSGRQVVVLFDSDIIHKREVAEAAKAFGHWVKTRGGHPFETFLPEEPDGDKNGPDDFVVRHGAGALIEHLQAADHIGWPLPASLLKADGELRGNLSPIELTRAAETIAGLSLQDQSVLIPVISSYNRLPVGRFESLVRTAMEPEVDQLEAELPGLDEQQEAVDWIIPGLLASGEAMVLAAMGGRGKSLLMYDIAAALATGHREFLGMRLRRRRILLIQTEEPAALYATRLAAVGLRSPELMGRRGVDWDILDKFDYADPRQLRRFEEKLDAFKPDLVGGDSLREIASNVACDENKDIGKRVARPLRKMLRDRGIALLLIHHSSGTSKLAGDKDIAAAVDRVVHLDLPPGADLDHPPTTRILTTLKNRSGSHYIWHLDLQRCPGEHQSEDCDEPVGWRWIVTGRGSGVDDSLPLARRVEALLDQSLVPLSLRDIAEHLALPPDGTRVNKALRNLGGDPSYGISRWRHTFTKGEPTTYWKPIEDRPVEARLALAVETEATGRSPRNPKDGGDSERPLYTFTDISGPSSNTNGSKGPEEGLDRVLPGSPEGSRNEEEGPEKSTHVRGSECVPPPLVEESADQVQQPTSLPAGAVREVEPARTEPKPMPPGFSPSELLAKIRAKKQANQSTPQPNQQPTTHQEDSHDPKPPRASTEAHPDHPAAIPLDLDAAAAALAAAFPGAEVLGDATWWTTPWEPPAAIPIGERHLLDPEATPEHLQELL